MFLIKIRYLEQDNDWDYIECYWVEKDDLPEIAKTLKILGEVDVPNKGKYKIEEKGH